VPVKKVGKERTKKVQKEEREGLPRFATQRREQTKSGPIVDICEVKNQSKEKVARGNACREYAACHMASKWIEEKNIRDSNFEPGPRKEPEKKRGRPTKNRRIRFNTCERETGDERVRTSKTEREYDEIKDGARQNAIFLESDRVPTEKSV